MSQKLTLIETKIQKLLDQKEDLLKKQQQHLLTLLTRTHALHLPKNVLVGALILAKESMDKKDDVYKILCQKGEDFLAAKSRKKAGT